MTKYSRFISIASNDYRDVHLPACRKGLCRLLRNDPAIDDSVEVDAPILSPGLQNRVSWNVAQILYFMDIVGHSEILREEFS